MPDNVSGKQLLSASWAALRQDKELIVLPVLSSIFAVICLILISSVAFVTHAYHFTVSPSKVDLAPNNSVGGWVAMCVSGYAVTTIAVFFQVALAHGAMVRMDGGDPTLGACVSFAWTRIRPILLWSAIMSTVGLVLHLIAERMGFVGEILERVFGVAWAGATFFVVPVIVVEADGSFSAVGRSKDIMLAKWGKVARSSIRFGMQFALYLICFFALFISGGLLTVVCQNAWFLLLSLLGVVGLLVVSVLSQAVMMYLRAALYRYAVGMPVEGISQSSLAGALRVG